MPWRQFVSDLHGTFNARMDAALATAGAGAIVWAPFLAAFDEWMPRLLLLGGLVLLGLRSWRQWRHRDTPPKN